MTNAEVYGPSPATETTDWKTFPPVQVRLPGAKRSKVTVPVGSVPPAMVAVSLTCPAPAFTGPDATVVMVGFPTSSSKAPTSHAVAAPTIRGSPRWSRPVLTAHSPLPAGTALTAALPGASAMVSVGPPLLATGPSAKLALDTFCWLPRPENPQVVSDSTLS